jgi:S1-C subfamily serine protease
MKLHGARRRLIVLAAAALTACAQAPVEVRQAATEDAVVPGTIGVAVRQQGDAVVVSAVGKGSDLRVGDVVLRYNGAFVTGARQFYRMVVDSRPGSTARLEVRREGAARVLEVPVRELDMFPRA